ncbi:MAG TPA: hypothetical protein VGM84_11935 [Steroidobacteraceae bacterium]
MDLPADNVIRRPWRVSVSLPAGARLWNVRGVPVAEIPTADGKSVVQAFDAPVPRPFARHSLVRYGAPISREGWDHLVNTRRSQRPPSRPPAGDTGPTEAT